jgi:hypothetical protein
MLREIDRNDEIRLEGGSFKHALTDENPPLYDKKPPAAAAADPP